MLGGLRQGLASIIMEDQALMAGSSQGIRAVVVAAIALSLTACSGNPLSRKYEYEEEIYLRLDGSATMYVNAAVPALVALRGLDLPTDPGARLDRQYVRALYDSPSSRVANISTSRRDNRRYVHLRLDVPDIRHLAESPPFSWSRYGLAVKDGSFEYSQHVNESANRPVGDVGWQGSELVAFRMHLPSRVTFHNSPSREVLRGNIIVWEQLLSERQQEMPVEIQVRMDTDSILSRTLLLFGAMIVLVAITFVLFIWFIKRRGPVKT